MSIETRTHNKITFEVRKIELEFCTEDNVRFQCFFNDMPLTSLSKNKAISIMDAIAFINKNPERFNQTA